MCENHHCEINADFTKPSLNSQAAITILFQPIKASLILIPQQMPLSICNKNQALEKCKTGWRKRKEDEEKVS